MTLTQPIILASSSSYRRQQLAQLGFQFNWVSPDIDETWLRHEQPDHLAKRLAITKATKVLASNPTAIVIGSDQVADLKGQILGKPLSVTNARAQLSACANQTVTFYTAVCVASKKQSFTAVIPTIVKFLPLSPALIKAYIEREKPLDCVGSFKCEGLGITLFESISSDDPSALIGLPLISVNLLLAKHGFNVLGKV